MAARLHKSHSEDIRLKIKSSVIIDRLQKHLDGELELSKTQLQAAQILLDRSVPKLQHIQHTGEISGKMQLMISGIDALVL